MISTEERNNKSIFNRSKVSKNIHNKHSLDSEDTNLTGRTFINQE